MKPLAQREGLLVEELDNELVIYELKRHLIHSLNPTTACVWRHCDGETTTTKLAALLTEATGLPNNEDLVWVALEQLEKIHLLREPLPMNRPVGLSRRATIRRLGLAANLALLFPAVSTMLVPSLAMAQGSCDETATGCAQGSCNGTCSQAPLPSGGFVCLCVGKKPSL